MRTWEGKTEVESLCVREREKGTKQDRLMLRQAGTALLTLTHTVFASRVHSHHTPKLLNRQEKH